MASAAEEEIRRTIANVQKRVDDLKAQVAEKETARVKLQNGIDDVGAKLAEALESKKTTSKELAETKGVLAKAEEAKSELKTSIAATQESLLMATNELETTKAALEDHKAAVQAYKKGLEDIDRIVLEGAGVTGGSRGAGRAPRPMARLWNVGPALASGR